MRSGDGKKQLALNRVEMADCWVSETEPLHSVLIDNAEMTRSNARLNILLSWVLWDVSWARGRLHQYVDFGPNFVFLWVNI